MNFHKIVIVDPKRGHCQPPWGQNLPDNWDMDAKQIFADNLKSLIEDSHNLKNIRAIARKANMGHGSVSRALNGEASLKVEQVEGYAKAFGVALWQLFVPGLNPRHPPALVYPRRQELVKLFESINNLSDAQINTLKASLFDIQSGENRAAFEDSLIGWGERGSKSDVLKTPG